MMQRAVSEPSWQSGALPSPMVAAAWALMGALADGALSRGGRITGVLPRFMNDLEWGHAGLTELHLVEDMHTRKHRLLSGSYAVVALPGGSGTLEELLEAITLKRLGLYFGPIVLVNTRHFFDPLLQLLASAIEERFMDERHRVGGKSSIT
jgi:uncharacterized protein (TIGR00730 family)